MKSILNAVITIHNKYNLIKFRLILELIFLKSVQFHFHSISVLIFRIPNKLKQFY